MIAVINVGSNVVEAVAEQVSIDADGTFVVNGDRYACWTTDTHRLSPCPAPPADFLPSGYTLDAGVWRATQEKARMEAEQRAQTVRIMADAFQRTIQAMLDRTVQERRYDSILSACSYTQSSIPQFAAEAQACLAWRDAVWQHCLGVLDAVSTGARDIPTLAALLEELPRLTWPE